MARIEPRRPVPVARILGRVGVVLLGALLVVAVAAPLVATHDPTSHVGAPFTPPSATHWLGTNDVGQDTWSELVYGTRVSLLFGLVAASVGTGIGLVVGVGAGTVRGPLDALAMRVVDVVLVIPFLPLLLVVATFVGGGLVAQLAVISAVMWARPARELRAQTLSMRERPHVQATLAMGASKVYVLFRHLLPGVATLIPPQLVRAAKAAILLEASLSFLGLGDPMARSWGTMLYYANARGAVLGDTWIWWVLPPGLALAVVVVAFALVGYALEDWSRPRLTRGAAGAVFERDPRSPYDDEDRSSPADAPDPSPANPSAEARASASEATLHVSGLHVGYETGAGLVAALRGVDLAVAPGEVVGVVGESGSGKSTLVNAVLGLVRPPGRIDRGRILFEGRDLREADEAAIRGLRGNRIALVPQMAQNALDPVMRVRDQIGEAIVAHGGANANAARGLAAELLEKVHIPEARHRAFPHELSGGMRQRVLVAMALANGPALLLADEPTTGLDSVTKVALLELLAGVTRRSRLSMLLVSHDVPVVLAAADRVAVMRAGRIVETAAPTRLVTAPEHPYTRSLLEALDAWQPRRGVRGLPPPAAASAPAPAPSPGPRPVPAASVSAPSSATGPSRKSLRVQGISKRFPSSDGIVAALQDVSLTVEPGEIVGLVGRSGAGKSTLARLVFGLETPDKGWIELPSGARLGPEGTDGRRVERRSAVRHQLVLQDPYSALPPHLRVEAVVAEPLRLAGDTPSSEAVVAALESVGLHQPRRFLGRFPHELSGGELQRVALARAVVVRPSLIVADEPASLLDAPVRAAAVAELARIRERLGTAILYVTHDIGLSGSLCDRLVVLAAGRVVEEGPTDRLLADPRHEETRDLVRAWRTLASAAC